MGKLASEEVNASMKGGPVGDRDQLRDRVVEHQVRLNEGRSRWGPRLGGSRSADALRASMKGGPVGDRDSSRPRRRPCRRPGLNEGRSRWGPRPEPVADTRVSVLRGPQ